MKKRRLELAREIIARLRLEMRKPRPEKPAIAETRTMAEAKAPAAR